MLVAVNLDPGSVQAGTVSLDLAALGLDPDRDLLAPRSPQRDDLRVDRARQLHPLDPATMPAHIFHLERLAGDAPERSSGDRGRRALRALADSTGCRPPLRPRTSRGRWSATSPSSGCSPPSASPSAIQTRPPNCWPRRRPPPGARAGPGPPARRGERAPPHPPGGRRPGPGRGHRPPRGRLRRPPAPPVAPRRWGRRGRIDGASGLRHRFRLTGSLAAPPGYHRLEVEGPGVAASALVISAPGAARARPGLGGLRPPPRRADEPTGGWPATGNWPKSPTGSAGSGELRRDAAPLRLLSRRARGGAQPLPAGQPAGLERALRRRGAAARARARPRGPPVARLVRLPPPPGPPPLGPPVRSPRHPGGQAPGPRAAGRRPGRILVPPPWRPRAFLAERPEVEAYARFRAATETLGRPWTQWPGRRPGRIPAGALDERRVRYHRYAQWAAAASWPRPPPGAGSTWTSPSGPTPRASTPGSIPGPSPRAPPSAHPPDDFQPAGQDWGINPLHPERIRQDGYRYPIAVLRHALRHAAMVRIDHVMGLHRLWWVPEGMAPPTGPMSATGPRSCGPSPSSRPPGPAWPWWGRISAPSPRPSGPPCAATGCSDPTSTSSPPRPTTPSPTRRRTPWRRSPPTISPPSPRGGPASTSATGCGEGCSIPDGARRRAGRAGRPAGRRRRRPRPPDGPAGPAGHPPPPGPRPGPAGARRPRGSLAGARAAEPPRHRDRRRATSGGAGPGAGPGTSPLRTQGPPPFSGSSTPPAGRAGPLMARAPDPRARESMMAHGRRPAGDRHAAATCARVRCRRGVGALRHRPLPLQRGDPSGAGRQTRRPPPGRGRDRLRGVGPERPLRQRHRGLQRLGPRRPPPRPPGLVGDLGGRRPRRCPGPRLQVRHHHRRRSRPREGRSLRLRLRVPPPDRIDRLGPRLRLGRRGVDGHPGPRAARSTPPSPSTRSISVHGGDRPTTPPGSSATRSSPPSSSITCSGPASPTSSSSP